MLDSPLPACGERDRERGTVSQCPRQKLQHGVRLREHLVVPETQNADPARREATRPFVIACFLRRVRVCVAVDLDSELGLCAVEVEDEPAADVLTPEVPASQTMATHA